MQSTPKLVVEVLGRCEPEPLTLPVRSLDHADHVLRTALMGYPELAADHLLHPEVMRDLPAVISSIARRATLLIERGGLRDCSGRELEDRIVRRARIYKAALELVLNFIGVEREWAGISGDCADLALRSLVNALESWEAAEREELGEPGSPLTNSITGGVARIASAPPSLAALTMVRGSSSPFRGPAFNP